MQAQTCFGAAPASTSCKGGAVEKGEREGYVMPVNTSSYTTSRGRPPASPASNGFISGPGHHSHVVYNVRRTPSAPAHTSGTSVGYPVGGYRNSEVGHYGGYSSHQTSRSLSRPRRTTAFPNNRTTSAQQPAAVPVNSRTRMSRSANTSGTSGGSHSYLQPTLASRYHTLASASSARSFSLTRSHEERSPRIARRSTSTSGNSQSNHQRKSSTNQQMMTTTTSTVPRSLSRSASSNRPASNATSTTSMTSSTTSLSRSQNLVMTGSRNALASSISQQVQN